MTFDAASPLFALELAGGAIEARYRRRRPHLDAMPWDALDITGVDETTLEHCRRWWTEFTLQEYAAAGAQAGFLQLLVRAGAPLDLMAVMTSFPFDEFVHAEMCARVVLALGEPVALRFDREALLGVDPIPDERPLLSATRAVLQQLCVAEQCTLGTLRHRQRHAGNPLYRALWSRMARDEAGHARTGWLLLAWAGPQLSLSERFALRADGATTLRGVEAGERGAAKLPETAFHPLSVFGAAGRES